MRKILTFVRDVKQSEWPAFSQDFKAGDKVYWFTGHTYGVDRDDLMYLQRTTIPASLDPEGEGFFTVPVEFLVLEDGQTPKGAYVRLG